MLALSLRILDHAPPGVPAGQVWKGGAIDLATRSVQPQPPRWLVMTDQPPPDTDAIAAWDLRPVVPDDRRLPTNAGGLILVSMDVDPDREDEFNDWYNTEHIPRQGGLPGVLHARRFQSLTGPRPNAPAYVALYFVKDTAIYASPAWVTGNETPWMLRMRRFQRNRTYYMFPTQVRASGH